ncbi:MAG TPA: hypothetical protein DCS63_02370 [Elusimicrobia bacterium]|nr:hypothetical protein [Elusimicrobiota bacterium]
MKKIILTLSLIILCSGWARAGALITYQGRLKESGSPVNANKAFTFEFCADPAAAGCVASADGAQSFQVANGLFKSTFTAPAVDLAAGPWYLRVSVDGTPLVPLEMLTMVPYAVYAASASYSAAAVQKTGDTLTGQLTLAGSSITVTGAQGIWTPAVSFAGNVAISSASAPAYGGISVTTHVYLAAGAKFYGDGSGLTGVTGASGTDDTKVSKTGDTMTGQLTLAGATMTVKGTQGLWTPAASFADNVVISSASGTSYGGFAVSTHVYLSPGARYYGDGSGLTGVTGASGTDITKVLKTGDTMTGPLAFALDNNTQSNVIQSAGLYISTSGAITTTGNGTGAVAGNARGLGAVDLQTARMAGSNVASEKFSVISGGYSNTASGTYAVAAGGNANSAGGSMSSLGGGNNNIASGILSVVPGGDTNTASGIRSFAAGFKADSSASGAFTWADSEGTSVQNSAQDRAVFKTRGGFLVSGSTSPVMTGLVNRGLFVSGGGLVGVATAAPQAALDVVADGAGPGVQAQIWRDSSGVVVGSMSASGNMMAVRYIGDGSGLSGVSAASAPGDNLGNHTAATNLLMGANQLTGYGTVTMSSYTATSALGLGAAKLRFNHNVELSSTAAVNYGGVYASTHVYTPGNMYAAKFYGDGTGLSNVSASVVPAAGVASGVLGANVVASSVPAVNIGVGKLGAQVLASSVAVGSVYDGAIIGLTAFKLSGPLPPLDGTALTGVTALGAVQKTGDVMSGQLTNTSSVTITGNGGLYGLQVSSNVFLAGTLFSANGNVGIGISNPTYKMDVNGPLRGTSLTAESGGMYVSGTSTLNGLVYGTKYADYVDGSYFFDGDATGTGLALAGSVAVGMYTPAYKVDVIGGGHFTSSMTVDGKYYGDGSALTGVISTSAVAKAGDTMTGGLTLAGSTLTVTGGRALVSSLGIQLEMMTDVGGGYIYTVGGHYLYLGTGQTNRMSIDPTGNVAINKSPANYRLDVGGDANIDGQSIVGGTLTVNGNAFSVGGSTLVVKDGNIFANGYMQVSGGMYLTGSSTFTSGAYFTGVSSFSDVANVYYGGGNAGQVLKKVAGGGMVWASDLDGAGEMTGTPRQIVMFQTDGSGGMDSQLQQDANDAGITMLTGSSMTILGNGADGLGVSGATKLNGNTSVLGANTFTVGTGLASLGGGVNVGGDADLNAKVNVDGTATFMSSMTALGNTQFGDAVADTHGFNMAPEAETAVSIAGQPVSGDFAVKFYSGTALIGGMRKK